MPRAESDILRSFAWPTYLVAFLLVTTPAFDYLTNVFPLRVGDVHWRYGSVALLAGFLLTPLFGMMFAIGASVALRHRLVLRVLSWVSVIVGIFQLVLIVFFALDVLQYARDRTGRGNREVSNRCRASRGQVFHDGRCLGLARCSRDTDYSVGQ